MFYAKTAHATLKRLGGTLREALRVSPAETLRERSRLRRETLLQRCLTAARLRLKNNFYNSIAKASQKDKAMQPDRVHDYSTDKHVEATEKEQDDDNIV